MPLPTISASAGVKRGFAVAVLRHEDAFADDRFEERRGHARPFGELVEREQAVGLGVGHRDRDRGGEGGVGGVELAVEQPADDREGEALALEVADAGQPVEVLGPVPGDAAGAGGRGQEPALLVEADGVDGHVGPAGQLLDTQRLTHRPGL